MGDLISRQEAIDHWRLIIDATSIDSRYDMGFVDGLEFCISHLSTMPAVQPEIIRCKDCRFQDKGRNESESWNLCGYRPWLHVPTEDEHYCGYAKRRTE